MSLWDYDAWNLIIQIGILLVAVLLGNIVRRKVSFVRNSLLPSSVLGGIFIFVLKFIPKVNEFINTSLMEILTYHMLGLGFIALALKTKEKTKDTNKLVVMDSGIITVNGYLIQGLFGLGLTLLLSVTVFKDLFPASGLLLPMGFGQGTGQALNIGKIFESKGFENGANFGLAVAAIGFIVACIVGVIYLNYLKKTNKLSIQEERKRINGEFSTYIYAEDEAPLNESIDKLTVQIAIIALVYLVTFGFISVTSKLAENYLGNLGTNTVKPLLWGFNFLLGTLFAILFKKIFVTLKKKNIMTHQHVNNFMMNRLSGFFFDIMIVAGIAAIDWQNLKGLFWPLVIICAAGTIFTFLYLKFVCKRIYPKYEYEAFFSIFGMLTGTASTGMILLREIDSNFETPACDNLVLQQLPAVLFGAPLLLIIPMAADSMTNALVIFGVIALLFIVYNIILLRKQIFKKKSLKEEN